MYNSLSEALEWLRFVLNPNKKMPTVTDWMALYKFANKQNIIGVCNPTKYDVRVGIDTLSLWICGIEQIRNSSIRLNKRVEELSMILDDAGLRHCILKGQGNAEMYPEPLLRMPGDIDVWIDEDKETVQKFVRERFPEVMESYKHVKYPIFDDVPVDVHVTPLKFYSPKYNKRLQRWIEDNKKEQFEHWIQLTGGEKGVSVPTARFNVVYQLGHMLIHLYDEGVGLRHLVDYFYVLKNLEQSVELHEESEKTLRSLGMLRFAKAVMWIECDVLGLPKECCIVNRDEKLGKRLLDDILDGGNFGKYSQRYKGEKGFYWKGIVEAKRLVSLINVAPREAVFCLLRKMRTAGRHFLYK